MTRSKSFYASRLVGDFASIRNSLESFVRDNAPDYEAEEASGFLNFNDYGSHVYFVFYRRRTVSRYDPGRNESYKERQIIQIPIGVVKNPFMILIFTGYRKIKDSIMEQLPIEKEKRYSLEFSSDFIELLNSIKPSHPWANDILNEDINPRGRMGGESRTHKISEEFGDIAERATEFKRGNKDIKISFTSRAKVDVALPNIVVTLSIYPGGKASVVIPPKTKLETMIPYVATALGKLLERQERYFRLKK